MNNFLYNLFGDWSGTVVYSLTLLFATLFFYFLYSLYIKRKNNIQSSKLSFLFFLLCVVFVASFLANYLKNIHTQNLELFQAKVLKQKNDAKSDIDPSFIPLIDEILKQTEVEKRLIKRIAKDVSLTMNLMRKKYPNQDEKKYQYCQKNIKDYAKEKKSIVLQEVSSLYVKLYSIEEMKALIDFANSPLHKRINENEESIKNQIGEITDDLGYKMGRIVSDYMAKEVPSFKSFISKAQKEKIENNIQIKLPKREHLLAAKEYFEISGCKKSVLLIFDGTIKFANDVIRKIFPGLEEKIYIKCVENIRAEAKKRFPKFIDDITIVFANHFTLAEFKELNDFYSTPLGKKAKLFNEQYFDIIIKFDNKCMFELVQKANQCMLSDFKP